MASINLINNIIPAANFTISAGDLLMPATSSSVGRIQMNSTVVFQTFGMTNVFIASSAGNFTNTSTGAVVVGSSSGLAISTASAPTIIGSTAGQGLSTGEDTTFVGNGSGSGIRTSQGSTAVGSFSMGGVDDLGGDASFNTAVGAYALTQGIQHPVGCTAVGYGALGGTSFTTVVGNYNVAVGYNALGSTATIGAYNVGVGYQAGFNFTNNTEASNIMINSAGIANDQNTLRIGTGTGSGTQQLAKAFISGIDGVNVGSVAKVVTMASNQLGTAAITAGAGIVVTPGANTITISTIGGGLSWSVISANQTAVIDNGYFCNKAGTLTLALPAASAVGDEISVTNENTALGIQFTQAAGQQILIGNTNTTLGATGTLTSSAVGDTLTIVCKTANTIWRVVSMMGNWTPA